ncbi:Ig-like domain repeat protein [Streptomyces kebangsaanensis]|uniref:Ig-like domain repeat protein n=1 Tax=Streptomyces kebangsaanensis TaxID=864058 RepID=A0ABW6L382_9ACTN
MTAVIGVALALALAPIMGTAAAQEAGTMAVTDMKFTPSAVDATHGGKTVTLRWTMTDTTPGADGMGVRVYLSRQGTTAETYLGVPLVGTYDVGSSGQDITLVPGSTARKATYEWTLAVPQYAAGTSVTWAVSRLEAWDTQGTSLDWGASQLGAFHNTFKAKTLADTQGPTYDDLAVDNERQPYVYVGEESSSMTYRLNAHDSQAGISGGTLTLTGPGGQHLTGSFAIEWTWYAGYQGCGYIEWGQTDARSCRVSVTFPAHAASGTWTVTQVELTDNAGNTSTYDHLSAAPVHVTSNDVLSADGFTATPNPVDTWHGARTIKVGFRPHGDQGGVTSAVVNTNSVHGCRQTSTTATTAADGTVSVDYEVPRQVFTCHITGLIITDNAGNVALYGSEFGAQETGLTITSAPDTVLPEIDQATLSPTTIPATEYFSDIRLTVNVSGTTAGVNSYSAYLIDSSGQAIEAVSGGAPLTFNGPLTISFPLPFNVAPGTYTIALRLSDQAYKSSSFGFPNGTPMPGGPVTLTVT